jgi:hypothetical protein
MRWTRDRHAHKFRFEAGQIALLSQQNIAQQARAIMSRKS